MYLRIHKFHRVSISIRQRSELKNVVHARTRRVLDANLGDCIVRTLPTVYVRSTGSEEANNLIILSEMRRNNALTELPQIS